MIKKLISGICRATLAVALALCGVVSVLAQQGRDAGLLTTVNGDAIYQSASGSKQPVASMIKMRESDRVDLGSNAKLQIVYFSSGVVETWQGAASFVVGADKSTRNSGAQPASRKLPLTMVESLARGPQVISDVRQRTGMTVTRSLGREIPEVAAARKRYEQARTQTPPDDPLPEIALFIELYEARRFAEAAGVLEDALKHSPGDPMWSEFQRVYRGKLGRF